MRLALLAEVSAKCPVSYSLKNRILEIWHHTMPQAEHPRMSQRRNGTYRILKSNTKYNNETGDAASPAYPSPNRVISCEDNPDSSIDLQMACLYKTAE